jgi:hypothetical protein
VGDKFRVTTEPCLIQFWMKGYMYIELSYIQASILKQEFELTGVLHELNRL